MPRKSNTRAAQGSGTVRQRPDGRWEARYVAGHDPGTGKQIRRSIYGATQKEVLQKLKQVQAGLDNGTYTDPNRMTISSWFTIWLAEYLGGIKENSQYDYASQVRNHIVPALGAVKLQKLKPHQVQEFYNSLQRDKGLSPKTIKNVHGVLHSALKQAQRLGYIQQNPADNINLPRVERPEVQPMPENIIPAFLQAIQGHEFEALYFVTVFTGLRKGEVLGLTWECIDFERGQIFIKQQLLKKRGENLFRLAPLKNDRPRTITPARDVMAVLRGERIKQKREKLAAGNAWNNSDNLCFTNPLGRHLIPNTVYYAFKRIAKALGVPDLRFHDLRHTYAVNVLRSGDDIKTVQEILSLRTRLSQHAKLPASQYCKRKHRQSTMPCRCSLSVLFLTKMLFPKQPCTPPNFFLTRPLNCAILSVRCYAIFTQSLHEECLNSVFTNEKRYDIMNP